MTFPSLFSGFVVLVAIGIAGVATRWLDGRARVVMLAVLAAWLAYATTLGLTGVASHTDQIPPGLALLTVPVMVAVLGLTLTRPGAVVAASVPLWLLLGFQVFRVGVELSLHHLWSAGLAPRIMTLEGGNIEIVVGITAPVAAWLAFRGTLGRRVAWVWSLVGILSLGNVIARAVLSVPGPLDLLHTEVPDLAIVTYPFTFVPGFLAPLALALHVLAFRAFRPRQSTRINPEP